MPEGLVSSHSRTFRFVRFLARMMLRSQYRQIEVEGADRIPTEGGVLIVANHFSSLVDSMALLHASPRPAAFLAKAPLWKTALLRPFLDGVGAIPVYRAQDRAEQGRGARANVETFEACRKRLAEGGSIALFPEGVSQPQPRLMAVRTGAARIVLDAGVPVHVVPAGLVYEPARRDGRGTVLVRFGQAFVVDGAKGFASRREAITSVTRRIEAMLRELLAEAPSQSEMVAIRTLRVVWDQERGHERARTLEEEHRRNRRFARGLESLRQATPEKLDALLAETDAYVRALDLAGVSPELLEGRYTLGRVVRFLLTKGLVALLGTPVAWLAALVTWPIRKLGDVIGLRAFGGSEDVRALCRMLGGGVVLVLLMLVGGVSAALLGGPWWGLGLFVGLPALLAFHVAWQDHRHDVRTRINAFFLLAGGNLRRTLQDRRKGLYEHLLSIGDHLPEA